VGHSRNAGFLLQVWRALPVLVDIAVVGRGSLATSNGPETVFCIQGQILLHCAFNFPKAIGCEPRNLRFHLFANHSAVDQWVNVMITIFGDFDQFSAKNYRIF
jgi:hypothetical protein